MSCRWRQRWSALRLRLGMVSLSAPITSSSGSRVLRRNSTMMASSAGVSTVLAGFFGPMGASVVVARLRHFRTVLGLRPYWAAMALDDACAAWGLARTPQLGGRREQS